jgi:hypothetical protein
LHFGPSAVVQSIYYEIHCSTEKGTAGVMNKASEELTISTRTVGRTWKVFSESFKPSIYSADSQPKNCGIQYAA